MKKPTAGTADEANFASYDAGALVVIMRFSIPALVSVKKLMFKLFLLTRAYISQRSRPICYSRTGGAGIWGQPVPARRELEKNFFGHDFHFRGGKNFVDQTGGRKNFEFLTNGFLYF